MQDTLSMSFDVILMSDKINVMVRDFASVVVPD